MGALTQQLSGEHLHYAAENEIAILWVAVFGFLYNRSSAKVEETISWKVIETSFLTSSGVISTR